MEITGIVGIAGITSSHPKRKRREDYSATLVMQRSGGRSIVLMVRIWKSAKLF
jgi:hypothetical protein